MLDLCHYAEEDVGHGGAVTRASSHVEEDELLRGAAGNATAAEAAVPHPVGKDAGLARAYLPHQHQRRLALVHAVIPAEVVDRLCHLPHAGVGCEGAVRHVSHGGGIVQLALALCVQRLVRCDDLSVVLLQLAGIVHAASDVG